MATQINKLTPLFVRKVTEPGWYGDGGGLWLQVTPSGSRSWLFRYKRDGKTRVLGLGALHTISLAEAREKARGMRQQLLEYIDPYAVRNAAKAAASNALTFGQACGKFIEARRSEWKNEKHISQWENTLETYCKEIWRDDVRNIQVHNVLSCLEPIWETKTETASRVRQRMEKVLDWSAVNGYRTGSNPAAWRGVLENVLPSPSKITKKKHHPSLPYKQAPEFMVDLRTRQGLSAQALEFLILTATRSGEVRMATWDEIDGDTWTIPAERMKAGKEHRVPLSSQAQALLSSLPKHASSNLIFPSAQGGKAMSDMTLTKLLRGMDWKDEEGKVVVPHGFRSTLRMWAAEQTDVPREVAEHALSHQLQDKVEAAYQRGSLFNKRVELMQKWGDFICSLLLNNGINH